jgi:DNA-binding transcriptional LysR family regulator
MAANLDDLAKHEFLILNSPTIDTNTWLFEGPNGVESMTVRGAVEVNIAESLIVAIREGMGIGMLPVYAALGGLLDGSLVRVLPDYVLQKNNIYALHPSRNFADAKTRTWIDFLRSYLPDVIARDRATLGVLKEIALRRRGEVVPLND